MNDLAQLTACVSELAAHASNLAAQCRQADTHGSSTSARVPQPLISETSPQEILQVKKSIAVSIAKLQTLVQGPTDFLQHLAHQLQLLACMQWLGEFQILAFIPLDRSVPLEDIAELASVPQSQLRRIVRLTATAGFLQEPPAEAGHVAHTALSAQFSTKLSYLDAAMFLSDLATPTSLQMAQATKRFGQSTNPSHSAYNMARGTAVPFASVCDDQQSKLRRQWPAYLKHVVNCRENGGSFDLLESLGCLDRLENSTALVVEVAAESTERALLLASRYPNMQFAVQMTGAGVPNGSRSVSNSNSSPGVDYKVAGGTRIAVSRRTTASPQPIADAAIYILDLAVPCSNLGQLPERISAELRAHMDVLRSNSASALILMSFIAPNTGTTHAAEETTTRLRELCLFQLYNQELPSFSELSELVNNTNDRMGRLSVVREAFSRTRDAVALEVRYLPFPPN